MVLFSPLMTFTSKMLDVTTLRHRIIADNIANVNTPGYKRSEVSFGDALERIKSSENESTPQSNDMLPQNVNEQLMKSLTLDDLYTEGRRYEGDLGVNFAMAEAKFKGSFAEHPAAGVELDPRATGQGAKSRSDIIASVQPKIVETTDTQRSDGNNVSPEIEMSKMIKNTSFYNVLVSSISNEFRALKTIISSR